MIYMFQQVLLNVCAGVFSCKIDVHSSPVSFQEALSTWSKYKHKGHSKASSGLSPRMTTKIKCVDLGSTPHPVTVANEGL